ncbi:hypothetical protein KFK14_11225 [Sphingobium phenoxybenzoativorans]|uniref:Uncharacterized protein n=1 Tax=Sphingobium phenoxybenzoativorans TaxID=1592790 RepID=A0A975Q3C4_9SPHN|nr:hypothetical protein [Sphingobium phenoxybenzoativorans]QUT07900.1 hypothetical protein KFK14_11225 [Sphingobium phenoxybenzoativorans]
MLGLLPTLALRHWKLLLSGLAVALLLAWGGIGWNRAGHWKKAYNAEHQAYGIFRARVIDRTKEATAAQNALNAAEKEKSNEAARQSQANFDALQRRYAGLLRAQGSSGQSGRTNPAAQDDAAGVAEGLPTAPGSAEGSVCMTSENMARLSAYAVGAHDLAADLVAKGLAEWSPE